MSEANDPQIELESKLMFLENTLESLNEVVLAQGLQLERLSRQVEDILGRVADFGQDAGQKRNLEDDRPPHY